jgi:hypothetical protein
MGFSEPCFDTQIPLELRICVLHQFPSSFKALVLQNQRGQQNNSPYNNVRIVERPIPALKPGEILVKIDADGLNQRGVLENHYDDERTLR